MNLNLLLKDIKYKFIVEGDCVEILSLTHDSRKVEKEFAYICLNGNVEDGHNFVDEAIRNGASLIVVDKNINIKNCYNVNVIQVDDTRVTYAKISANFYNNPQNQLKIVGIIGTNGKSTTAHIIYELLTANKVKVGLIGTICCMIGDKKVESSMTTPDPFELFGLFSQMVDNNISIVVMEVSAHAIYLKKIAGIIFDIGIFTNFSQDHLDYFKDMDSYKKCKQSFFNKLQIKLGILNIDDECGQEIANINNCNIVTYGTYNGDYCADKIELTAQKSVFKLHFNENEFLINSNLLGKFNVYNLLASLTTINELGFNLNEILKNVNVLTSAKGRFNCYINNGITYIIDYAHTPDGLLKIIKEVKNFTDGKVIVVFGCGGNRDKLKRPIMGEIASNEGDIVILTSDNPRFENKVNIIEDIKIGIKNLSKTYICVNREDAIKFACDIATNGDNIIIAGKGCENYIEENGIKIEFNDKLVLEKILGVDL